MKVITGTNMRKGEFHTGSCRITIPVRNEVPSAGYTTSFDTPQGKMVYVIRGEVFDVAVDIRLGSPTFGQWVGYHLSEENRRQLFIPEGFAHGFFVLSESADVTYKCTDVYVPGDDFGLLWSDPSVGIEWPDDSPLLSDKDNRNPPLSEIPEERLPNYRP